jgi:hypothetical protein
MPGIRSSLKGEYPPTPLAAHTSGRKAHAYHSSQHFTGTNQGVSSGR